MLIRHAASSDAAAIAEIYNYYILYTIITFEFEPVTPDEIAHRMEKYKELGPFLVCEEENEVVGYAYVSKFRERPAYDQTVESTIYLKNGLGGRGLGTKLYSELIAQVERERHLIVGVLALPNEASVRLHEKCGFIKTGYLSEAGRKFGKWIDIGFWQKNCF